MIIFCQSLSRLWRLSCFLSNLHSHTYLILEPELEFRLSTVPVSDVISIFSLDFGKATGCDEFPLRFLKACPAEMGRLVATIINLSISTGTFPDF